MLCVALATEMHSKLKKRSMTAQLKAEPSMLEMLSGYMCQQLASWMRDGKEDGL